MMRCGLFDARDGLQYNVVGEAHLEHVIEGPSAGGNSGRYKVGHRMDRGNSLRYRKRSQPIAYRQTTSVLGQGFR